MTNSSPRALIVLAAATALALPPRVEAAEPSAQQQPAQTGLVGTRIYADMGHGVKLECINIPASADGTLPVINITRQITDLGTPLNIAYSQANSGYVAHSDTEFLSVKPVADPSSGVNVPVIISGNNLSGSWKATHTTFTGTPTQLNVMQNEVLAALKTGDDSCADAVRAYDAKALANAEKGGSIGKTLRAGVSKLSGDETVSSGGINYHKVRIDRSAAQAFANFGVVPKDAPKTPGTSTTPCVGKKCKPA